MSEIQMIGHVPSDEARTRIRTLLASALVELMFADSLGELAHAADLLHAPCLVLASESDADTGVWDGLAISRPVGSVLVVLGERMGLDDLPGIARDRMQVARLDSTARELGRAIFDAYMASQSARLSARIDDARHLSYAVRKVVKRVLCSSPAPSSMSDAFGVVRDVQAVADLVGLNRESLSRELSKAGVRLGSVADEWRAIWALGLNQVAGQALKNLAEHLGYDDKTGPSKLTSRVYGKTFSRVTLSVPEAIERFERETLHPLLDPPEEKSH